MYVCMKVCMYVSVHVCIHVLVHACVHAMVRLVCIFMESCTLANQVRCPKIVQCEGARVEMKNRTRNGKTAVLAKYQFSNGVTLILAGPAVLLSPTRWEFL